MTSGWISLLRRPPSRRFRSGIHAFPDDLDLSPFGIGVENQTRSFKLKMARLLCKIQNLQP